jgi:hypothetical protein
VCKRYGITAEGTFHGCIDEAFIGIPCPSHFQEDPSVPSVPVVLTMVQQMGKEHCADCAGDREADCRQNGLTMLSMVLQWQTELEATPVVY